jgi:hypothetical protein
VDQITGKYPRISRGVNSNKFQLLRADQNCVLDYLSDDKEPDGK